MNRFDMLVNRQKNKPTAYCFKKTSSPARVCDYMKVCIYDGVAFDASNFYPSVIDQALMHLQKEKRIPIITGSEKTMRTLNMFANLKRVHVVDNIPENVVQAICYWDLDKKTLPKSIDVILSIVRKNE